MCMELLELITHRDQELAVGSLILRYLPVDNTGFTNITVG